jgi:hypothetical protein
MNAASISEQIDILVRKFGSLDKLAYALKECPGFETLSRATVHHWRRGTAGRQGLKRASLAIQYLERKQGKMSLRLAIPAVAWALPILALDWQKETRTGAGKAKDRPYGLLRDYHVELTVPKHIGLSEMTGQKAVTLLDDDQVAVAFAGEEIRPTQKHCHMLCRVAEGVVEGLSVARISSMSDLKDGPIGHKPGSVMLDKLEQIQERYGIILKPLALESVQEFVKAFKGRKIKSMVGWQPLVGDVEQELRKQGIRIRPFNLKQIAPTGFTPALVELTAFVNLRKADPSTIRVFLKCLSTACMFFEARKTSLAFLKEILGHIRPHFRLELGSLRRTFRYSTFRIGPLNPPPILSLWEKWENERHEKTS